MDNSNKKAKSSRKGKGKVQGGKVKIIREVQPAAPRADLELTNAIEHFTKSFLQADSMVLPRAVPTRVVSRSFKRNFTVENCRAASVRVESNLRNPITITRSAAPTSSTYAGRSGSVQGPGEGTRGAVALEFGLVSDGRLFRPGNVMIPEYPVAEQCVWEGRTIGNTDVEYRIGTGAYGQLLYPGQISSISGAIELFYSAGTTGTYACELITYDANYGVLDSAMASAATDATSTTFTFASVPDPGAFFSFQLIPNIDNPHSIVKLDASATFSVTTAHVDTIEADPALQLDYEPILKAQRKWSHVGTCLVISNRQSTLADGGNCCVAAISRDYPISLYPTAMYDQVTQLHHTQYYTGRIANGVHASYLPEDMSQWFFKSPDLNTTGGPTIYASFVAPNLQSSDDILSLNVSVQMHYEFIIPSQAFEPVLSMNNTDFLMAALGSIRRAELAEESRVIGENPDHLKRIASIARKVAQDEGVQQAAKSVWKVVKGAGKAALPLLATALL